MDQPDQPKKDDQAAQAAPGQQTTDKTRTFVIKESTMTTGKTVLVAALVVLGVLWFTGNLHFSDSRYESYDRSAVDGSGRRDVRSGDPMKDAYDKWAPPGFGNVQISQGSPGARENCERRGGILVPGPGHLNPANGHWEGKNVCTADGPPQAMR